MCERIEWARTNLRVKRITVKWDWDEPNYIINPGRKATKAEYESVPKSFVCLCCNERHVGYTEVDGEKVIEDLGGSYHDKWLCRFCIEYVDEWTAGTIIWFDRHKIKNPNAKPAKRPFPPPMSNEARMEQVVRWAKRENKPIQ